MKIKSSEVEIGVGEEGEKGDRSMFCSKKTTIGIGNFLKRAFSLRM